MSYLYHNQLTVKLNDTLPCPVGYSVSITFDHAALVTAGKSLSSGDDLRVFYDTGSAVEIERVLDLGSAWNTTTTKIWFRLQRGFPSVAGSSQTTDTAYWLYYGDSGATFGTRSVITVNPYKQNAEANILNVLAVNHGTFGGTDYWAASPFYTKPFTADIWLVAQQCPQLFTATQLTNWVDAVIAVKDGSGNFPISLTTAGAADVFYSGFDTDHHHVTGDSNLLLPQLTYLAYQKSSSLTHFNSVSAALKVALGNLPKNGTTKLITSTASDEWVPWGFEDGVFFQGDNLWGSLLYYQACVAMQAMYTAAGDSANASFFATEITNVAASLTTSSALWNSGSGMFYASTVNNIQIDVSGSAFAVYLGITDSTQNSGIASYLVSNISTLEKFYTNGPLSAYPTGFLRISPSNWGSVRVTQTGIYDNGYWLWHAGFVAAAMRANSTSAANQLIKDGALGMDPALEYWAQTNGQANGTGNNTCSPAGIYAYILAHSSDFADTTTSVSGAPDPRNVFYFFEDFTGTPTGWTHAAGTWTLGSGKASTSPATSNEDVKLQYSILKFTRIQIQSDIKINTFTAADHATAGIVSGSKDTGTSSARGLFAGFRGSSATTTQTLNEEVAWISSLSFTWTTGTTYRVKIGSTGATGGISNFSTGWSWATWAAGSAEAALTPFSPVPDATSDGVSFIPTIALCSAYSTVDFTNVIVRLFSPAEPTVSLVVDYTFSDSISLSDSVVSSISGSATISISGSDFISLVDSAVAQFGIIFPPSVRGNIDYDQIRTAARSGDGPKFLMLKGSFTAGHVIVFDADGNAIDSGHT